MKILIWVLVEDLERLCNWKREGYLFGTEIEKIEIWQREPSDSLDVVQVQISYDTWFRLTQYEHVHIG